MQNMNDLPSRIHEIELHSNLFPANRCCELSYVNAGPSSRRCALQLFKQCSTNA